MKYFTFILSFFTFMSCCNSKKLVAMENNKQVMEQVSGTYYLTSVNENDSSLNKLTLQFDDETKTISGFSGCNRFTGTYSLNGNSISFGPLASTRMACSESENKMEQTMLMTLNNVNSITVKNHELTLSNKDTVLIKATKNSEKKISQDSNYKIEYTIMSRGLFNEYIFENGNISIQKDRATPPIVKPCSLDESRQLLEQVKKIDLEKLNTLKAPSEKRFYDGAAIAILKVTYQGESYQTPEFDNGEPNKYIASLVSALLELAEKQ